MRVVVFGGSGFVGRAICSALMVRGIEPVITKAPRLKPVFYEHEIDIATVSDEYASTVEQCRGAAVVINSAGIAHATKFRASELLAANSALPGLLGRATRDAGVKKFIHVSSAAVQGRVRRLTADIAKRGFSPYSWSKVYGEGVALRNGPASTVVHRPAGVHAADRRVTRQLTKYAASPVSTVGGAGDLPTPQALVDNVGDAIAFLATTRASCPSITTQPSEGLTTGGLLEALGGQQPRSIPLPVANSLVEGMTLAARPVPGLQAYVRRLELLWLGQAQATSWLTAQGWHPPLAMEEWHALGAQVRNSS